MKSTRQRILETIENRRMATTTELSQALHVTKANVRYHMADLIAQGLLEVSGERAQKGRGRPSRLFSLAGRFLGDNLDRLSGALLDELLGNLPEEKRQATILRLAGRLAGLTGSASIADETLSAQNLARRLVASVQWLNQHNYQARWEAHAQTPRLVFGVCPYAEIIADHPELCQLDASLLEHLLHTPSRQTQKLARDPRGATYCEFRIERAG